MPQAGSGSADLITDLLRQLFQGHGVEAVAVDGRVLFPSHPRLWADGELFHNHEDHPLVAQLDVRLGGFDGGRTLIESFAGIGEGRDAQARFALQSFASGTFPVLLSAFFDQPLSHGAERETWNWGTPRDVWYGPITSVFGFPPPQPDSTPDFGFFKAFVERVRSSPLPLGTHWFRIYQMRRGQEVFSNEVLLDNDPWEGMREFLAQYPWQEADEPYDVRVFAVLKDGE